MFMIRGKMWSPSVMVQKDDVNKVQENDFLQKFCHYLMSWCWWGVKCILYKILEGRTHKLSQGLRSRGNMNWKLNKKLLYYKAKLGLVSPFLPLTSEHDDLVSQYPIIKITHGMFSLEQMNRDEEVAVFIMKLLLLIMQLLIVLLPAPLQLTKKLPFDHFSYIFGWGRWIVVYLDHFRLSKSLLKTCLVYHCCRVITLLKLKTNPNISRTFI